MPDALRPLNGRYRSRLIPSAAGCPTELGIASIAGEGRKGRLRLNSHGCVPEVRYDG